MSQYGKFDAKGKPLPDDAKLWSIVKDNATGLTWEVKTDDGSIHDKGNTYNWPNAQSVFIAELNAGKFGGFSDWRLPTRKELAAIVDYNKYDPVIDTTAFPNTMPSYYWSSTTYAYDTGYAWCLYFLYGYDVYCNKSSTCYVRAVRGRQPGSSGDSAKGGKDEVSK